MGTNSHVQMKLNFPDTFWSSDHENILLAMTNVSEELSHHMLEHHDEEYDVIDYNKLSARAWRKNYDVIDHVQGFLRSIEFDLTVDIMMNVEWAEIRRCRVTRTNCEDMANIYLEEQE